MIVACHTLCTTVVLIRNSNTVTDAYHKFQLRCAIFHRTLRDILLLLLLLYTAARPTVAEKTEKKTRKCRPDQTTRRAVRVSRPSSSRQPLYGQRKQRATTTKDIQLNRKRYMDRSGNHVQPVTTNNEP